jgi:hypothetical protein
MLLIGTFGTYLVLQVYATIVCRGRWRAGTLLPLVWMVPVGVVTAQALRENSNLWPCMLIPASVTSFAYLAVLTTAYRSHHTRAEARGFEVKTQTPNQTPGDGPNAGPA